MWILILCGYSLLRAVLAWPILARYGINPAAFLFLDVVTAYPLALGQVRIVAAFRTQDFAAAQRWCGVAGGAFLTPYAYLFLAGHAEMPVYASVALAVGDGSFGHETIFAVASSRRAAGEDFAAPGELAAAELPAALEAEAQQLLLCGREALRLLLAREAQAEVDVVEVPHQAATACSRTSTH